MNAQSGSRSGDLPFTWDLLGAFLAVMRTGSLSGAARALGVAQPTVRRQISALEATLGAALFTRSHAGLRATEAAQATLPYAESMAGVAAALVRSVSAPSSSEAGTVRVTCSEILAVEVLPRILADLRRAHPQLQIELSATNQNEDLLRRDADVAIRMAPPTQGALVAKRVGNIEVGLFATHEYLRAHPAPKSAPSLRQHALVGRDRDPSFLTALASAGLRLRRQDFALRTDSDTAALAAVRAGLGIGVCQVRLAARDRALTRILPKVRFVMPTFVVTHEDLRRTRRIAVVFEHLARALGAYAKAD